ncbi:MAG: holo-ACP synthase [Opitutales bacterium]|jgi:holo-[acyl-carrier protein] synthase
MAVDFALPTAGPLLGVGVDIVDIDRIRIMRERQGDRFIQRVYTQVEQDYCLRMKFPDKHLAARFAAKEAVSKAFSTGIGDPFNWTSISVVLGGRGQPEIKLDEKCARFMESLGAARVAISLSHTEESAIAFAVLIGRG